MPEISKEEFARLRDALNREMEENGTFLGANMLVAPSIEVRQPLLTILAALDLAASASSPEPEEWLPIETAPNDGTLVLLYQPATTNYEMRLTQSERVTIDRANAFQFRKPTHWRPLPAPPASRHSDGERSR